MWSTSWPINALGITLPTKSSPNNNTFLLDIPVIAHEAKYYRTWKKTQLAIHFTLTNVYLDQIQPPSKNLNQPTGRGSTIDKFAKLNQTIVP